MGVARKYAAIEPTTGKIDRRFFSDQAVYDDEMENILGRAWLTIGHQSRARRFPLRICASRTCALSPF